MDDWDPMKRVHVLRSHLYHGSTAFKAPEQLLERVRMIDLCREFTEHYRTSLMLASTPLPFALVQMGRTFLFLWVYSMPFVLVGVFGSDNLVSVMEFTFFLTYGFIGLEFVAIQLMHPFGDGPNDICLHGMKEVSTVYKYLYVCVPPPFLSLSENIMFRFSFFFSLSLELFLATPRRLCGALNETAAPNRTT